LSRGTGQEVLLNPVRRREKVFDTEVRLRPSGLCELDPAGLTDRRALSDAEKPEKFYLFIKNFAAFLCVRSAPEMVHFGPVGRLDAVYL
jgi:hypothetical protein